MRHFFSALTRLLSLLFVVVFILACVGPIIGGALYLQRYGIVTTGEIVDKDESINGTTRTNSWTRRLQVTVRYVPYDQTYPTTAGIGVDQPTFDRLLVGSTVKVRYQPKPWMRYLPMSGVLLAEQTPMAIFSTFTYNQWLPFILGVSAFVLFFSIVHTHSLFLRMVMGALLLVSIVAIVVVSIRPAALFDQGQHATVAAQVLSIERITTEPGTESSADEQLLRAIDRVQIAFVPEGMNDQVLAVDDIDAGSINGLTQGQQVNISYLVANSRAAQIVGATREHRFINWLMIPWSITVFIAIFTVGCVFVWLVRRLTHSLLSRRGIS